MQPDLEHAQASVDWAEANLPVFKQRLDAWLRENDLSANRTLSRLTFGGSRSDNQGLYPSTVIPIDRAVPAMIRAP